MSCSSKFFSDLLHFFVSACSDLYCPERQQQLFRTAPLMNAAGIRETPENGESTGEYS
jgi:hypothetical protein